jgi:radical SAM/Cys-rich protein
MVRLNHFERKIAEFGCDGLYSQKIEIIQVNLGLRCNQQCTHCHLEASPERTETMPWPVMELVLEAARHTRPLLIDLTGGAPELNPWFRRFVTALRSGAHTVQVRTNLTVLLEPDMGDLPGFFREHAIRLVASLPCYLQENVCAQRGEGVYEKSIEAIRRLNAQGYGSSDALPLSLVYNPGGPFLPPPQASLEGDYRRELGLRFGIRFTHLLTITNMALGRFERRLERGNQRRSYRRLLRDSFNPRTVGGLMCRRQISVGWDGTLYDCDFNLALGIPVNHGAPDHIQSFSPEELRTRRIVTGEHCFGCTAGSGSSCGGALVREKATSGRMH